MCTGEAQAQWVCKTHSTEDLTVSLNAVRARSLFKWKGADSLWFHCLIYSSWERHTGFGTLASLYCSTLWRLIKLFIFSIFLIKHKFGFRTEWYLAMFQGLVYAWACMAVSRAGRPGLSPWCRRSGHRSLEGTVTYEWNFTKYLLYKF